MVGLLGLLASAAAIDVGGLREDAKHFSMSEAGEAPVASDADDGLRRSLWQPAPADARRALPTLTKSWGNATAKPKGVFILKVGDVAQAQQAVCLLTTYFNREARSPVRVFADTDERRSIAAVEAAGGEADVQVQVDTKR